MIKRKPTYKQMAFETAIRNPERYKDILLETSNFENKVLNDETLLEIVSSLYLSGIVTSKEVIIDSNSTTKSISQQVINVNSTRRADGGFPKGYQSRFWTYMRTLSELGFVYAQYNKPFLLSEIAKKLIKNEIDEQEAFSIQAMKYNRKSPYRNVLNDFNYFKFILDILKRRNNISYEQFVVSTLSLNGDVDDFLNIIDNNKFNDLSDVEKFVRSKYKTNLKTQTILRDYPDVILRLLTITGFISIQYKGKVIIYRNIDKDNYIDNLLNVNVTLTEKEKEDPYLYFKKFEKYNTTFLNIVYNQRKITKEIDGYEYVKKVNEIIKEYNLDEDKIKKAIQNIESQKYVIPEFQYITKSLQLEFFISMIIAIKYGNEFAIKPNYKADYFGLPISHAPGNKGDIEVYSKKEYWLIEVTLIRNITQQLNSETTTVIRHLLDDNKINQYSTKYLSFVAPYIHQDTEYFFNYSIILYNKSSQKIYIKPYIINDFIEVTLSKNNFQDMEIYTNQIIEQFLKQ